MSNKIGRLAVFFSALVASVLLVQSAPAQYRVHSWESFEEGILPESLIRGHNADESTVKAVNHWGLGLPPATMTGIAPVELGRFGMAFKPTSELPHLSIVSPVSLNRQSLGAKGSALYQADFFLPAEGVPYPTSALLAQQISDETGRKTNYRYYRFGILENSTQLFFAGVTSDGPPDPYFMQDIKELELTRPGWHRFQIIFVGQSQIFCAIDGKFTKFSPIEDPHLRVLNAGLMVTSSTFDSYALMDNLSIQWTAEDAQHLPESPWTKEFIEIDRTNRSPLEPGSTFPWLEDPAVAFDRASRQNRPLLAMFYIPRTRPYGYLSSIVPMTSEAQELFNAYVLTRIDANQLHGGRLAEQFQIVRVPTFIVLAPNGQILKRITVTPQTTWESLKADLQLSGPETASP